MKKVCIEGNISVNKGQIELQTHGACKIRGPVELTITNTTENKQCAHFMILEVKYETNTNNNNKKE